MSRVKLGAVVIGQSPRPDLVAELRRVLGDAVGIDLRGALDGLTSAEIDALPPADGFDTLFTKLPSGETAVISKKAVTRRMRGRIAELREAGADVLLVCCTGAFDGLDDLGPLIFPSRVLDGWADALAPQRLAVLIPLPEQVAMAARKWARPGRTAAVEPLLPPAGSGPVDAAAHRLAPFDPDLVIMDCISYTRAQKARVQAILGRRVLLGLSAAARTVQELLD